MENIIKNNNQEEAKTSSIFRQPPSNVEAEQAILGAILVNNRAYEKVSEFLKPIHFAEAIHRRIFEACSRLIERGQLADPITLRDFFEQDGTLGEIGGQSYLMQLAAAAATFVSTEDYGRIIHDRYLRRELIAIGQDMAAEAYQTQIDSDAGDLIEGAEQKLFQLSNQSETRQGFSNFANALTKALATTAEAYKNEGQISGVSTGFSDLDKKMGGLHNSDLIIIAGRPGMGKTALATNIAYNAAEKFNREAKKANEKSKTVAFFSLEMSSEQLATRILSSQAQVSSHRMRTGEIEESEFNRLAAAVRELETLPLFIDDTPGLTVSNIRTRARRLKRERGLGMIVIDYLQLITPASGSKDGRVNEVSEMTRGLKILAKELDVPVICLSQLNRSVESREDKRPLLSDLRESGSIEQDADVVMFVFREFYYLDREEPVQRPTENDEKYAERIRKWEDAKISKKNTAEAIIAKQRHGPTGIIELWFNGDYTEFGNLMKEAQY
ncbi:MAG: replicative DNA helicase [Alphaproteobacteria bacterium]